MKTNPVTHLFLIALVAAFVAGCASAPSRFYTLTSTVTAGGSPAVPDAIVVGPVSVPTVVDRPQFTLQVAPNRVAVDEFNRWAGPLNENIASVIAGDLSALLGTPRVGVAPLANFGSAYHVAVVIQLFESVPGKLARVDALWVIRKPSGGTVLTGHTVASEPVSDKSFDALAAAHSRALAKVSADIAAAIRAEADRKP